MFVQMPNKEAYQFVDSIKAEFAHINIDERIYQGHKITLLFEFFLPNIFVNRETFVFFVRSS